MVMALKRLNECVHVTRPRSPGCVHFTRPLVQKRKVRCVLQGTRHHRHHRYSWVLLTLTVGYIESRFWLALPYYIPLGVTFRLNIPLGGLQSTCGPSSSAPVSEEGLSCPEVDYFGNSYFSGPEKARIRLGKTLTADVILLDSPLTSLVYDCCSFASCCLRRRNLLSFLHRQMRPRGLSPGEASATSSAWTLSRLRTYYSGVDVYRSF